MIATFIGTDPHSILIEIAGTKGSTPRETGTFMLVSAHGIWGTIGGGQFEYIAIDHARAMLRAETEVDNLDIPLGPEIGQCCGGRTQLQFRLLTPDVAHDLQDRLRQEQDRHPAVFIFGAGHVGKALAFSLEPLPLAITVIETRADELDGLPLTIDAHHAAMPESLVATIPPGGAVLIVTHDHALDFLIAREALARTDLAYIGMIGSATKRATFASWLVREGGDKASMQRMTLPIGDSIVRDKRPEVIAAMTTAEVLTALAAYRLRGSAS